MLYCSLKSRKNTQSKNPKFAKTKRKNNVSWKCAVCDSKKSRFIKEPENSGSLGSLGLKTLLSNSLVLDV